MDIDEVGRRQRGIVTRAQALHAGLTIDEVKHRLRSGRWQRLSAGIYATSSGAVPRQALRWAAVLRAGPGAMLSHRSAAEEVGLIEAGSGPLHVTVPAVRHIVTPRGTVVHRCRHAAKRRHPSRSPPQTRIEETVLDLAVGEPTETAMGWIAAACGARLTTPERISGAMRRRGRVAGRPMLAGLLEDVAAGCMSVLERRYLHDVERPHGLPEPARQSQRPRGGGYWYDDVYYPDFRVRIELDGRAAHPAEQRWRDFRRDNSAVLSGDVVLRYGAADIRENPCGVAAQVAEVLRQRGWAGRRQRCQSSCRPM
ncbi:type IV toxin-antitoxin system AbiEi family antitoxin domain-containing protein [Actinoplanes sp. NBC_00393]|uniref:type IV toxin-antitoxin system AbiEi family antitoxin domain-containing protein n=1 Tax=Actinoplanes sp. NBC_00393 TaxID=2975953 RepID=UPI002E1EE67B